MMPSQIAVRHVANSNEMRFEQFSFKTLRSCGVTLKRIDWD